eukprot:scaffold1991_cov218-Pinguiococcus_pyrenoidosus.AAC.4
MGTGFTSRVCQSGAIEERGFWHHPQLTAITAQKNPLTGVEDHHDAGARRDSSPPVISASSGGRGSSKNCRIGL